MSKAMKTAQKYLQMTGYDVIEQVNNKLIFVYDANANEVALCKVSIHDSKLHKTSDESMLRQEFEKYINKFFNEHDDYVDVRVRFDSIVICIIGMNRGIVRHLVNGELED